MEDLERGNNILSHPNLLERSMDGIHIIYLKNNHKKDTLKWKNKIIAACNTKKVFVCKLIEKTNLYY